MNKLVAILGTLAFALTLNAQSASSSGEVPVPGHGALVLNWPSSWTQHVREGKGDEPPTVEITDPNGDVTVLLTPLWSPTKDPQFTSAENIKASVAKAAEAVQESAVESELALHELNGRSGRGYYFWATDRAPKKGEYEYMASGAAPAGDLLVSFTILTHTAPPKGISIGLVIAGSCRQISTNW